jgi:hypothetical protein
VLNALLRVKVVEDGVCIALIACCEDNDVTVFAHIFDDFFGVRSNTDISADDFALDRFERDLYFIALGHEFVGVD